jgi:hypothetical protein
MRIMCCFVLVLAAALAGPARAAVTCPFIGNQHLAGAMPAFKWSLISNQDGRGCIFRGERGDCRRYDARRDRAGELDGKAPDSGFP